MRWLLLGAVAVLVAAEDAWACPDIRPLDGQTVRFGTVPIGTTSAPRGLLFHNYGPETGTLCHWGFVGDQAFSLVSPPCVSLDPGQEVMVELTCLPPANGDVGVIWDLQSDCDRHHAHYAVCTGGYFEAPIEAQLPSVYVDQTSQTSFTLRNIDAVPRTITALQTAGAFAVSVMGGLPQTVEPGASVDVSVTFDPSTLGTHETSLSFLADTEIAARVFLHARALGQIQPEQYNFLNVPLGAHYEVPITIRNSSAVTREITSATFSNPSITISNVVGTELAPGASVAATVTYEATAMSLGSNLTIAFDGIAQPTAHFFSHVVPPTFEIHGEDAEPDDGLLVFGDVMAGSGAVARTVTFENTDSVEWQILACKTPAAPFGLPSAPCDVTPVAPGGSYPITISFEPTTLGDHFGVGQIWIRSANGGFARYVALAASAHVVPPPPFTVSMAELMFEGPPGVTQAITITNQRDVALALDLSVEGAAFMLETPASITIPAHGTADVVIRFAPLASGTSTGQLVIGEPGGEAPTVISLAGTYEPDPPPPEPPAEPDGGCSTTTGSTTLLVMLALGLAPRRRRCDGASRQRN